MLRAACWMSVVAVIASSGEPRAQPDNGSDQGSNAAVLTAQDVFRDPRAATDGTSVLFEHAVVRAKAGNALRVLAAKHEIFVVPADPSVLDFLAVGAHVDIQGTLRHPPAAPQARLVYAMSTREARRLAHARFYVDASSVLAAD